MKSLILLLAGMLFLCVPATPAAAEQPAEPLTPSEIYRQVSPAIPQILTDYSTGSGILIEWRGRKYVVTNRHVVWPQLQANVIFPDGQEFNSVPVIDWDMLVDIAVLGPIETDIEPAEIAAQPNVAAGDPIYLLGYPAEAETYAQPAISQGLISRLRPWDREGVDYFQTGAESEPGQSGGALLAAEGAIIGLSTYSVGEYGNFIVSLSSRDVLRRVRGMLLGRDVDGVGDRFRILDDTDDGRQIVLNHYRRGSLDYDGDTDVFTVSLREGQRVLVWIEWQGGDPALGIGPADGSYAEVDYGAYAEWTDVGIGYGFYYDVPADGEYLVLVDDMESLEVRGYIVGVDDATEMAFAE